MKIITKQLVASLNTTILVLLLISANFSVTKAHSHNHNGEKEMVAPSNCPASPLPVSLVQSDNTTITIIGKGNLLNNWTETTDGYSVKLNSSGIYEYARKQNGNLVLTGVKANDPANRSPQELAFISTLQPSLKPAITPLKASILSQVNSQIQNKTYPTTGNVRILTLLIDYSDLVSRFPKSDFDSLLYGSNFRNGDGSFKYYYETASDSQITVTVDVFGWYRATNGYLYYGADSGYDKAADLVREAVDAAELAGVNFANYDNNNDNRVDGILAVHAGPGAEQGSRTQYIWSHRWVLNGGNLGSVIYDGVTINDYMVNPETRISGTAQNLVGIGVFCHEFGHNLGLPDLYDTDASNGDSEGIGNWCLMAGGVWLGGEHRPANFSAWCRIENGWASPTQLTIGNSSSHTMNPSTTHPNDIYRVNTSLANEYFLLENRQKSGLDMELPGEGLAIWHINTNKTNTSGNRVNGDVGLKGVDLEEADGNDDLDSARNRGDNGDLYPGSSTNRTFNNSSSPNSQTYTNTNTNLELRNITENGSLVTFDFGPAPVITCTGNTPLTASTGSFDDGSGASNYANNLNCSWLIQPPGASSINLTFSAFNVDPTIDRVAIYDGIDFTAPLIGTYTGTTIPAAINSSGGSLYIEFTTNNTITSTGWSASYTSSSSITPTCSGNTTLTTNSGTFNDGSGPNLNYTDNLICDWLISPPSANTIQLNFDSLDLAAGDTLYIYDGSNSSANLIGAYSGNTIPAFISSSSSTLFLSFQTDASGNDKGWQVSYNSFNGCSGTQTFTAAAGVFNDGSSLTQNYSDNLNCSWLIQPTGATFITLSWNRFFTENRFDFVRVYDGTTTADPLLGSFSGTRLPTSITSSSGSLLVVFTTDGSVTFTGWEASYTSTNIQCLPNRTLTAGTGNISDGSGANNYSDNLNCSWLIQPTFATNITLTFNNFDTESTNDVVNVYDGTNNSGTLLGSFSGNSIPAPQSISGTNKSMFVEFITNSTTNAAGWDASYTSTSGLSCSGTTNLTAASASFDDGSGPSLNYDNNLNCGWLIQPTGNPSLIELNFNSMNVIFGDVVRIYDGTNNAGTLIGSRTGTFTGGTLRAFSGAMFVEFTSNTTNVGPGWSASYSSSNTFCVPSSTLSGTFGNIDDGSPFNQNYANNTDCEWLIQPAATNVAISFRFFSFDTEAVNDTVTIYDGATTSDPILGTFSGTSIPPTTTSSGGSMLITFKSNGSTTASGWRGNYSTQPIPLCSGTTSLTAASGTFNDGSAATASYIQNSNCSWLIQPTGASRVSLSFNRFNTASADDSVTVYDGPTTSAPVLGRFFGGSLPPSVTSSGGSMLVNFRTNAFGNSTGWDASYSSTTSQCFSNLTLTAFRDTIRDGSGSNNYADNLNCSWLIQPPTATSISLNFTDFDLAGATDSVKIYDGVDNNAPLIAAYGGTVLPPTTNSTSGDMFIEFITDGSLNAQGWKAYYDITSSLSCIGTTNLSGASGSFNDGSATNVRYDNNLNCGWLIQPSNNPAVISLDFTRMSTNGFSDRVFIYDGINSSGNLIGSLFGTNTGTTFSAFSGSMYVEFVTDGGGTAFGWDANYSTSSSFCVPTTTFTNNFGFFDDGSPFGVNYLDNTSCQWLIQPTATNIAVALNFFGFDTESNNDTVTIYDGATTSDPILATYSGNTIPPSVTSSGGSMLVTFNTNSSITSNGWRAQYSTQPIPFCVGRTNLTGASGTFDDGSGNNLTNYIANSNCNWLIQPPGAVSVDLTFNYFRTQQNFDFVNVYDGTSNNSPLLGSFSGTTVPPTLTASSGTMYIEFTSNAFVEDIGWEATYTSSNSIILNGSPDTVFINAGAGNQGILNIASNTRWSISDNAIWLLSNTINGQGNQAVNLIATQPNIGPPRYAEVYISSTTGNIIDTVIAAQRSSGRFLVCNPDTLFFSTNPTSSQNIGITSNVNWNLSPNSTWISLSNSSGSNNGTESVTVTNNSSPQDRIGFIVATGTLGASNDTIFVKQDGTNSITPMLTVNPGNVTLSQPMNSSGSFDVNSNVDWQTSTNAGWLNITNPPITSDTGTVQITTNSMNNNANPRNAFVAVQDLAGTLFDTVFVTQLGTNPILEGSPDTVFLASSQASTASVNITSNGANWTAIEGDIWFSSSATSGIGSTSLILTSNSANTSNNLRVSYLALADPASFLVDTVIVVQDTPNFQLSISPTSANIGPSIGSNQIFTISSNLNWTVSNPVTWLGLSSNSGSGNASITATSTSNNLTGSNRTATLTFSAAGISDRTVTITQIDGSNPLFDVSLDTVFISNPQGSTGTFSVLSNQSGWSLTENTPWLLINPTTGDNTQLITALVVSRNVTGNTRYADVTASLAGFPDQTVTIAHEASNPLFQAGPQDVILGPNTDDIASFNISSNLVSWKVIENSPWMEVSPDSGGFTRQIVIRATDTNKTNNVRIDQITIESPPQVPLVVNVRQDTIRTIGLDEISLLEESVLYPNPTNGMITLELSGVEFDSQLNFELYNAVGVRQNLNYTLSSKERLELNLSSKAAGLYYISLTKGNIRVVKKIILTD